MPPFCIMADQSVANGVAGSANGWFTVLSSIYLSRLH